jgi:hypothetical protein
MSVAYTYLGIYKSSPLILIFQKVIGFLKVFLLVFTLTSLVAACGSLPMKLLTGGGPNVAANTQVAKVANQTLGSSVATGDQKVEKIEGHHNRVEQVQSQDNKVKTESVEKVVINEVPPWVILLLLVGWLLPTPQDIGNRIYLWLSHLVSKLKWRK